MSYPFHTLDVFTTDKFAGNPLAVVLNADTLNTDKMQTIAREFNLSETIFVQSPNDSNHTAKVRIFFPTAEIPFAGHPTIGCAILLAETANGPGDFETEITLEEVAGLVPVKVWREDGITNAQFTAPIIPSKMIVPCPNASVFAAGLGLDESDIGFGNHKPGNFEGGPNFCYVPLNSAEALTKAKPSGAGWAELTKQAGNESFYLYCVAEGGYRSRMYAPDHGIPEDPATGSASAILAAQLLASGELSNGHNSFSLYQGYDMARPSEIGLEIDVTGGTIGAVRVSGSAVRVMQGELTT